MATYISILRGINVGGKKSVKMDLLKKMYEELGFTKVTTYIQSGNVIFDATKATIKKIQESLEKKIIATYGFDVPVIVLSKKTLQNIISNNPLLNNKSINPDFLHITFLADKPNLDNQQTILDKKQAEEEILITECAVYLYCPKGYGITKLSNTFLESKLQVTATTRNWKTTLELYKLAEGNTK